MAGGRCTNSRVSGLFLKLFALRIRPAHIADYYSYLSKRRQKSCLKHVYTSNQFNNESFANAKFFLHT